MLYNSIIVDSVNLAHRTFEAKPVTTSTIGKRKVYKTSIKNFIERIEEIRSEYLHSDGTVYMLFDNYTSRVNLQTTYYYAARKKIYAKYKEGRKKESKEFYNSLNLLKYYYLTGDPSYRVIQMDGLEADDLVEPILTNYCKDQKSLLVTSDLDWVRYLSDDVQWLPKATPEFADEVSHKLGFPITTETVIAYKSLFGDPSDNIPRLAPEKYQDTFRDIVPLFTHAIDLLALARSSEAVKNHPVLKYVLEHEIDYRINLQLVSAIPVSAQAIAHHLFKGSNKKLTHKALREALELDAPKATEFVFGGIKTPRF